mmetsp:Transcript_35537/g.141714  ORF Transcript_35537/g.141714 Transcript_35537/m.141714 type:complete len:101 (-) Transcript_35537:915-1217(-)
MGKLPRRAHEARSSFRYLCVVMLTFSLTVEEAKARRLKRAPKVLVTIMVNELALSIQERATLKDFQNQDPRRFFFHAESIKSQSPIKYWSTSIEPSFEVP